MRMTAQNAASGKFLNVRRIRRAGLFAAFGLGLIGSVSMLIIAKPFSQYIVGSTGSLPAMIIISPSLFFCAISAVYKGYYEGLSNMLPTAISQVIEAIIKAVIGISLATSVLSNGGTAIYAAAAAIAGITIAEAFGLFYLILRTKIRSDGITAEQLQNSPKPQRKRVIIKSIINESLPITLAALTMNLNPFIDLLTIPNIINSSVTTNKQFFLNTFTYGAYGGEQISDIGNFIYGSYTGITLAVFALATSVTAMIGKSALPEIASAWEQKNHSRLTRSLQILFKGTFMAGLPICFGLAALANPILNLLYFSKPAEVLVSAPPLIVLGLGGISLVLTGVVFAAFIAMNRVDLQIKLTLTGAIIKLIINLALIRIPQINVTGAAISTLICYTFISLAGIILLIRLIRKELRIDITIIKNIIFKSFFKPMIFALLCAITAYICQNYIFIEGLLGITNNTFSNSSVNSSINLAMSISAGALVYLILTFISDRKYIKNFLTTPQTSEKF
jgi:stage V sporulation protein B